MDSRINWSWQSSKIFSSKQARELANDLNPSIYVTVWWERLNVPVIARILQGKKIWENKLAFFFS
ncbi:predicted protein [Sclerotinia sclerotiorum 1980 UF-70]|uniref:Uncharacterized protein n=1 Tax=Sclerotinia sclerotiorum (strain ATCC 18683 / 1980 / Ss-1) TaxID=665079 RepID=A7F3D3_SCLS1|nr:predicted protein [Sclerotinia sclerotiorum 1980 UF-70]EDN97254.1 predicted protein [Sclerotinia sclerotiorum 1980 UF-70]